MLEIENIKWLENWISDMFKFKSTNKNPLIIRTIDNPGWRISINLEDTYFYSKSIDYQEREVDDSDWVQFWVKDGFFQAAGGARNLNQMLGIFRQWVETGIY